MIEQEAINGLDFIRGVLLSGIKPKIIPNERNIKLMDATIEALENIIEIKNRKITLLDLENYMKFEDECVKKNFTLKSLLEAREKQIAKKPILKSGIALKLQKELQRLIDQEFIRTEQSRKKFTMKCEREGR